MGRHTPVQRRSRRMRANVPPLDQAHVTVLQQFIVHTHAKIESQRLQFLRREPDHLRADNYKDLWKTIVNQDGDPRNVGQEVILPATFCGEPRYMFEGNKMPWPTLENLADQIYHNCDNKPQVA